VTGPERSIFDALESGAQPEQIEMAIHQALESRTDEPLAPAPLGRVPPRACAEVPRARAETGVGVKYQDAAFRMALEQRLKDGAVRLHAVAIEGELQCLAITRSVPLAARSAIQFGSRDPDARVLFDLD
jgi:hypothetical protein